MYCTVHCSEHYIWCSFCNDLRFTLKVYIVSIFSLSCNDLFEGVEVVWCVYSSSAAVGAQSHVCHVTTNKYSLLCMLLLSIDSTSDVDCTVGRKNFTRRNFRYFREWLKFAKFLA